MKDRWTLWTVLQIIVGLFVVFAILALIGPFLDTETRVEPGTSEHAEYIDREVTRCVSDGLAADLQKTRQELPVVPTLAERTAGCLSAVVEMDRLYPESRPPKKK